MDTKKFFNDIFGELDIIVDESGDLWFVGNQVAAALGFATKADQGTALGRLDKEDRKALSYKAFSSKLKAINLWGKNDFSNKTVISEYGMYELVMRSDKPSAREFQKWVTHEVLPSIRKNGGYILGQENLDAEEKEKLLMKVKKLSDEVATKTLDLKRLQKRRHELVAEKNSLKEEKKHLKKEIKTLKECNDLYEKMLEKEMEEADRLRARLRCLTTPAPTKKNVETERILVDANGFVVNK